MLSPKAIDASQAVSEKLGILAENATRSALPDLATVGQQEAGGVIRTFASNLSIEIGNAASVTAVESYKDLTDEALKALYDSAPWNENVVRNAIWQEQSARFLERARAYDNFSLDEIDSIIRQAGSGQIDGALLQARLWKKQGFEAFQPKTIDVAKRVEMNLEGIVGNAMSKYMDGSFIDAENALSQGVNRMVQDAYRETIANNSEADGFVTGFQRVASPLACAFCLVVALNEYTSFEESGGYHDHCNCSTVPVYRGVSAYEPDYYAGFRADYEDASIYADGASSDAVLTALRVRAGRR